MAEELSQNTDALKEATQQARELAAVEREVARVNAGRSTILQQQQSTLPTVAPPISQNRPTPPEVSQQWQKSMAEAMNRRKAEAENAKYLHGWQPTFGPPTPMGWKPESPSPPSSGPPNRPPNNPPPNPPGGGGNNPPPSHTPVSNMLAAIAALQNTMSEKQLAYSKGLGPDDLAVGGLNRRMREQEQNVTNRFGGLKPSEQQEAMPEMKAMEQQRKEVEEEEIKRRKSLNQELTKGQYALVNFAQAMGAGNPMEAAGALVGGISGTAGGLAAGILGFIKSRQDMYREEISRGGEVLSPTGKDAEKKSILLREMEDARQRGEIGRQSSAAEMEQRQRQAMKLGLLPRDNPLSPSASPLTLLGPAIQEAKTAYTAKLLTGTEEQAKAAYNKVMTKFYEEEIKKRGGKLEDIKQNILMPGDIQAGITTSMGYQSELQVKALDAGRQGLDTEIMQEQLKQLYELGVLISTLVDNTNGLDNLHPQFAP